MKAINKLALVALGFAVLAKAHPGYLYAYPDAVGSSMAPKPIVTSPAATTVTLPCESAICSSHATAMNATTPVVTTTLPCTECAESSKPPATPTAGPSVPPKPAPPLSTGPSAPAPPGPVGPESPAAPSPTSPHNVPTFTGAAARYTINGYNFVLLATMAVFAIL